MKKFSLVLPNSIQRHLKELATKEGISINQLIASAVAEMVSAIATEEYLQARAERADASALQAILAKVPRREPMPGDEF
ncbi:toxin-antitoxin system HicB family antitoxin [Methylomonas sp. SURF-1]|uniref:Toxin-antitoxin system HicB family antitoxin n=1 Tax=Methylomonas aurea TaxID=2952224 RepID=A0ABT1UE51_9GAMM|nr:toxin-antitoxin system HicB family antitoxin [Methylomonas sp. SURF-1]MCQ8179691.1 toxin-antitoxin system HicB family antitoxin [Methylomonas sp. SURF-1]